MQGQRRIDRRGRPRARWKIENEGFNVLKTKGYNLEHNFGHGIQNLAVLPVCCSAGWSPSPSRYSGGTWERSMS